MSKKFKTILPESITTIAEAKKFLRELYNNGESYHPEDDAHDIIWDNQTPTIQQQKQLNKLMEDIYNLEGNNGNHKNPVFDPCKYLLNEGYVFMVKDLTGRGYNGKCNANILLEELPNMPEEAQEDEDSEIAEARELKQWIEIAEDGEEYQTNDTKYIRIN